MADEFARTQRDALFFFTFSDEDVRPIGSGTETLGIEAMAFAPPESARGNRANLLPGIAIDTLFAIDTNTLGVLDLTTGLFAPIASIDGVSDLDGLSFDWTRGHFWVIERNGASGVADELIGIDRTGNVVRSPQSIALDTDPRFATASGVPFDDIDEVAVDPLSGRIYGVANRNGEGGALLELDVEGPTVEVNFIGMLTDAEGSVIDDMEGLSFFEDGNLYGTTGANGPDPADNDQLWLIDQTTASVNSLLDFGEPAADVEALACFTRSGNLEVAATPTPTATMEPTPTTAETPTPDSTATPTPTNVATITETPTELATTPTQTPTVVEQVTQTPTAVATTTSTPIPETSATPTTTGPTPTASSPPSTTPPITIPTQPPVEESPPSTGESPPTSAVPPDGPIAYTGAGTTNLTIAVMLTLVGATLLVASRRRRRSG